MIQNNLLRERECRFLPSDVQLQPAVFDPADVALIVAIPAYKRQLEGSSVGTLPHLISDCVSASEREGVDAGILVSDDSPAEAAALNAAAIRCVFNP